MRAVTRDKAGAFGWALNEKCPALRPQAASGKPQAYSSRRVARDAEVVFVFVFVFVDQMSVMDSDEFSQAVAQ